MYLACMHICAPHVCLVPLESQEDVRSSEWEIQTVLSARTEPESSTRVASAFNL